MSKRYMDFAPKKAKKTTSRAGAAKTMDVARGPRGGARAARGSAGAVRSGVRTARSISVARDAGTVRDAGAVRSTKVVRDTNVARAGAVRGPRIVRSIKPNVEDKVETVYSGGKVEITPRENSNKKTVNFGVVEEYIGVSGASGTDKKVMAIPQTPFINQARVEKRPLSKHVYKKKIEATKEPETGPVTIIAKPEKEKHIGLIVTIIVTIILGATAGTVAFLLLPK